MNTVYDKAVFDFWIELNYDVIKQVLKDSNTLNMDALHDSIIETYIEVSSNNISDIEAIGRIFNRNYKIISRRIVNMHFKYILFEDDILEFIINQNYIIDESFKRISTDNIIQIAKRVLTNDEYKLLTLYAWSSDMTYENIGLYEGVSASTIHRKITNIREKVKQSKTI